MCIALDVFRSKENSELWECNNSKSWNVDIKLVQIQKIFSIGSGDIIYITYISKSLHKKSANQGKYSLKV